MLELLQTAESGSVGSGDKVATQRDIIKHADVQTVQKKFDLSLEMGPYKGADFITQNSYFSEFLKLCTFSGPGKIYSNSVHSGITLKSLESLRPYIPPS